MKAKRKSAGLLVFRRTSDLVEFFLVHPGGPFWRNKETGAWSIPKGEYIEPEEPLAAAIREFKEETGQQITGSFIPLTPIMQKAGKEVKAWAVESEIDANNIHCNNMKMEWPYKSGKWIQFPEIDKAAWFDTETAKEKINAAQYALIEEVLFKLANNSFS